MRMSYLLCGFKDFAQRHRPPMGSKFSLCETLENREHYSTTSVYTLAGYEGGVTSPEGVTAAYTDHEATQANGGTRFSFETFGNTSGPFPGQIHWGIDSFTIAFSGLPAHTMVSVSASTSLDGFDPHADGLTPPTITESYGGKTFTRSTGQDGGRKVGYGNWVTSNSSSIFYQVQASNFFDEQGYIAILGVNVRVYTPTISIDGGPSTAEGGLPLIFGVYRDLPDDYNGVDYGDDDMASTTVNISRAGTASTDDFTSGLPSSITLTTDENFKEFSVQTLADDKFFEDDETIIYSITSGTGYTVKAGASSATGTIMNVSQ